MPRDERPNLGSLQIRKEHDLVHLRRWIRATAEELALTHRAIHGLASCAFEAARILFAQTRAVDAAVRLRHADVEVRLSGPYADDRTRSEIEHALRSAPGISSVDIDITAARVTAVVSAERPLPPQAHPAAPRGRPEPVVLEHSTASLKRVILDLQRELEETNRAVVALSAELEEHADRLRQSEDRFRMLLDGAQDYAICMLDPQGRVESWNAGAERLFGYTADEIIGRGADCFYTAQERALGAPAEQLADAHLQGRFGCECLRVRKGGMAFDAEVLLTAVRGADGTLRGYSMVVRDTSVRKRLEDDLRRRADDLASANRAKEEFLATLSHELRTPLNAMLGWTRLLRMGNLEGPAIAKALETIERNAHIQEQLIADILDVSRIVTGRLRLNTRPMDLSAIVEESLDAIRPASEAKGVQLTSDVAVPAPVLGDPDRLQQVVWNLLANAIKFTPPGGQVSLSVSRVGPNAVITVSDTGAGIPPDLLPYIFDRFRQGDASVTRTHGGLGLGLSIVRHIVELHGGHVQAWSEGPGRGASFAVHLPVRAIDDPVPPRVPSSTSLEGVKVLVVDDDADAREVVAAALAQCGAQTLAAESASEAWRLLGEFRPHVLVSDIGMPDEDGYSFIRRVRQHPDCADLPAVALTGFTHAAAVHRALSAGYQRFVPKPVEVEELAAVVRTLVPV